MESIRKKAGYLEGLITAMKLDENDPDANFKRGVVSLLSEMAERIEAADAMLGELNDYVESIDDDLTGLHDHILRNVNSANSVFTLFQDISLSNAYNFVNCSWTIT